MNKDFPDEFYGARIQLLDNITLKPQPHTKDANGECSFYCLHEDCTIWPLLMKTLKESEIHDQPERLSEETPKGDAIV